MLDLQLAGLAGPCVAHLGTGVLGTVEDGTAHAGTLQHSGLATSHWLATGRRRRYGWMLGQVHMPHHHAGPCSMVAWTDSVSMLSEFGSDVKL